MVDEREKPRSRFAERSHYLAALLDSLEDQISVIDRDGVIHYTNLAWDLFAEQNGMPKGYDWVGVNYTEVCDHAECRGGDAPGVASYSGEVLSGVPLPQPGYPALVYDAGGPCGRH